MSLYALRWLRDESLVLDGRASKPRGVVPSDRGGGFCNTDCKKSWLFAADCVEGDEEVRALPGGFCCVKGGTPEAFPPVIFFWIYSMVQYL